MVAGLRIEVKTIRGGMPLKNPERPGDLRSRDSGIGGTSFLTSLELRAARNPLAVIPVRVQVPFSEPIYPYKKSSVTERTGE